MHIVHVIARLNEGGPARVLAALARELQALGHRVTILAGSTAADEPDLSARLRDEGLAIETVPSLGRRVSPLDDLRAFVGIARRLRALRPDLVHTHTAKAGLLGRLACRMLGLRCLHTYHGHVLAGYFHPLPEALLRWAERIAALGCHLHALTPGQLLDLQRRQGIGRPRQWRWLPVPVPAVAAAAAPWRAALRPGLPVVGFLGRLVAVKDADLWLDTLARLARLVPVQGLVCGDGPLRTALERRAAGLGVPVLFTGFVPAGEALGAMDLLLMTSRNEGLPLVAVEAGGLGVPVVAPAVGGLADLARWGAVEAAERDADALAAACALVLAEAPRAARLRAHGRALARRLAPAALGCRYAAWYRALCRC